jgi:F420H(2)-dependent quinone reductase
MLSGNRERADWVQNALREPRVTIKIRDRVFDAVARMRKDDAEEALAHHLLYEKYFLTENRAKTDLSISDWARGGLPVVFDVILPAVGK